MILDRRLPAAKPRNCAFKISLNFWGNRKRVFWGLSIRILHDLRYEKFWVFWFARYLSIEWNECWMGMSIECWYTWKFWEIMILKTIPLSSQMFKRFSLKPLVSSLIRVTVLVWWVAKIELETSCYSNRFRLIWW